MNSICTACETVGPEVVCEPSCRKCKRAGTMTADTSAKELEEFIVRHTCRNVHTERTWVRIPHEHMAKLNTLIKQLTE